MIRMARGGGVGTKIEGEQRRSKNLYERKTSAMIRLHDEKMAEKNLHLDQHT